ncbi:RagB/SusD family nutrient uptake outer membrane protein [Niastella caeni]|uniref:RagB/SusD family nutrient uptake outer membrane protein n=1 Tax=Niastella caeni TaxID=2569763 RepID=A0A4S8HMI0_9BACT|nr:RagB/SusD family nutrient uptake outer membrane protein [Niastella caeni]THU35911.1 RagB/SusD family nutrient uptake outer membrane protein [Niastella caeni]
MTLHNIKRSPYFLLIAVLIQATACKKDYTDPNKVPQDPALKTAKGLTGVVTGLQRVYTAGRASALYNMVTADGFVTRQLDIRNQGNTAEYQLYLGSGSVDGTNTILASFWTGNNKVIYDANNVINNAPDLTDQAYASGLIAYASIFKALALGNLAMFWEHVPDTIGANVGFVTSAQGFNKAIAVLDKALAAVSANPISASFIANAPAGIDIVNTLHALKARYSLNVGNYTQALAEANAVDLTKRSTFNFDPVTLNPIFETATSTNNVYQPIDSTMGLPPSLAPNLADKRVPFYIAINPTTAPRYRINGFGAALNTAFPVYLPGEMTLIKAEAYARQSTPDLVNALVELNKIITKKPASDPFGIGADLPPDAGPYTQAQLLEQIYRHRSIELYMSGLRLMDMRRLNRPTTERKRSFFPYPFIERDNNTNTPTDPSF